jgi:hypothetical protein
MSRRPDRPLDHTDEERGDEPVHAGEEQGSVPSDRMADMRERDAGAHEDEIDATPNRSSDPPPPGEAHGGRG